MKSVALILCIYISVTVLTTVWCSSYFFGEQTNQTKLIYVDKVKYEAIPLKKRVKLFNYRGKVPIKAIHCYDYQNSEASINITDGGIGFTHVELRMKSQRSYRLDYAIEIFG